MSSRESRHVCYVLLVVFHRCSNVIITLLARRMGATLPPTWRGRGAAVSLDVSHAGEIGQAIAALVVPDNISREVLALSGLCSGAHH